MYLAFLDILGFKDIIENNSIDDVYNLYSFFLGFDIQELTRSFSTGGVDGILNYLFLSDSIIIYTPDDSHLSFVSITLITEYILKTSLKSGFPLRGVIANGNLKKIIKQGVSFNANVLLGNSIVEAYKIEKQFDWSGCVISPNLIDYIYTSNNNKAIDFLSCPLFELYNVPKKSGVHKQYHVINWASNKLNYCLKEKFLMHGKKLDDWGALRKYENTRNFYEEMTRRKKG